METIENYKSMEKEYFSLLSYANKRKLTKKEAIDLWFFENELEILYTFLSKINEKYYPGWDKNIH